VPLIERWKAWTAHPGVAMGLSIGLATGLYGPSFGALAVTAGLSIWQACALSLLLFAGGAQFAFIGVLAGGGAGLAAWSAASLLSLRQVVYGLELNARLRPKRRWTPLMAHLTIDESMGTSSAQTAPDEERRGFWVAGVAVFVLWNLGTLAGALFGRAIGDPTRWGLDGAAAAAFLGLLWPRLKGRDPVALAVVAAAAALVAVPFVPPGLPILIAAAVAVAVWAWQRRGGRGRPTGPGDATAAPDGGASAEPGGGTVSPDAEAGTAP